MRVLLALLALLILTGFGDNRVDWLGVGLMLGSALMFAGTVILSQYVLYEMPSPTVTLYVLTTMAVIVVDGVAGDFGTRCHAVILDVALLADFAPGGDDGAVAVGDVRRGQISRAVCRRRCWRSPKLAWRWRWRL
jgi:hypothetical protein